MNLHLNPYKFRLMLDSLDNEFLTGRQHELLIWLLGWGRKGCNSYNYRIAKKMKCSVRTVRRDLRRLEKLRLIDIRGALGKHRRIVVIPYPNKATWLQNSMAKMFRKRGDTDVRHQRRLNKDYLKLAQEQRNRLLYGTPKNAVSAKTADGVSSRGETPRTLLAVQERKARALSIIRQKIIEKFISHGNSRERAIRLTDIKLNKDLNIEP